MDSDGIRMDTDLETGSDITIYHILIRFRTQIRILLDTNTKQVF
jgi:hypothetical protein